MFSFKKYFLENCIQGFMNLFESLKIKDYLESDPNGEEIYEWLFSNNELRNFVEKIDIKTLVKPLAIGKNGHLVINKSPQYIPFTMGTKYYEDDASGNPFQHRIPCKITKIEDGEIELERTDGKDFEELTYKTPTFPDWKSEKSKKKILVPASRIILVNNEKYLVYTRWLAYAVMKGSQESGRDIDNYFDYFWRKSKNKLYESLTNDKIISLLRTTETSPEFFFSYDGAKEENELTYPNKVNNHLRGKEGGEGEVLIEFPNGWKWLNLNRGFCREEGNAGGHCGNIGGIERGETILSLRDPENHVYLTFTLSRYGKLKERKGVGNKKPDKSLHPYIVKLLLHPIVQGIETSEYIPEKDFNLADLSHEHAAILSKKTNYGIEGHDNSELNLQLMRSIDENNFDDFIKNLIKKHPQFSNFNIINYSYGKNFIVEKFPYYSALVDAPHQKISPEWLNTLVKNIIFRKERFQDESPEILSDYITGNFVRIKKNAINEIINYLIEIKARTPHSPDNDYFYTKLKNINTTNEFEDENNYIKRSFAGMITRYARQDKNLHKVFYNTVYEVIDDMMIKKLNIKLSVRKNAQGFYFQIYKKNNEIYVSKCIDPSSVENYFKECEETIKAYQDENGEMPSEDVIKNIIEPIDSEIDMEYFHDVNIGDNLAEVENNRMFLDVLEKNMKYLHYR